MALIAKLQKTFEIKSNGIVEGMRGFRIIPKNKRIEGRGLRNGCRQLIKGKVRSSWRE
jgi:hypothetical protein